MRYSLIVPFLFLSAVFWGCVNCVSAQKIAPPRRHATKSTPETLLGKDAQKLTTVQRALVKKVLGVLDESDVLFFTARDGDRFHVNIRKVVPLLDEIESKLPKGKFYDLLNTTILAYMDFGILIQIVGIRHDKGEEAFDSKVTSSLADIANRYERVLGTSSSTDMLDPDIGARLLMYGVNLKKRVYRLL